MRIKKYIVNSLPDAMPKIKQELGQNAVILNTKKIRTGGFLGFFSQQKIEVIAAIDHERSQKPSLSSVATQEPAPPNQQEAPAEHYHQKQYAAQKTNLYEQKQSHMEGKKEEQELLGEIKDMKNFMLQMMADKEEKLPKPLQKINQMLTKHDITKEIKSDILTKLLAVYKQNPSYSDSKFFQEAREGLHSYLQPLSLKRREEEFSKLICFIGPTGVGKTTTIAKLAADYILKHKKKVGFITSDTYRIAAVEQLKTYATILNIPIEVVFSPEELQPALEKLAHCDMILMDTAGRNYLQEKYIQELRELLTKEEKIQTNLVLSLTSKNEDIATIIQNFSQIDIDCLILTKLDETSSYGTILNLIHHHSFPLTYITNGQNVPDDILVATPELITDLILGEDAYERSS